MGFFSGIRRRIKKIIPKEIRPFVPYIAAAMLPGPAASGLFKSAVGNQFMAAAAAKAATDDEADLKDILTTGTLAAAPQFIGDAAGNMAGQYASKGTDTNTFKFLKGVESAAKPEGLMGQAKLIRMLKDQ